ncbi:MAG: HAMP domain-containing histidine kinase [Sedimentisphaerales bacterium]|nr:HAMP domain-containing histidine kinase [Sedimentisphaerales bacterium]
MASFTEKRLSLYRDVEKRRQENAALATEINELQHLANMGAASYMIAHEINNLLAPIGTYAGLALANPDDVELGKKALGKAVKNCERAGKIVESMMALANGQKQEKVRCGLRGLLDDVFGCLARDFEKDGIRVNVAVAEDVEVWAVPVQLQQVLMNLLLNAREAMLSRGGTLYIGAKERTDAVEITVADTGAGIEASNLQEIFEPFFTTKKDGKLPSGRLGAGLGLAFCRRVMQAHNGTISVESKPGEGSTFKIALPRS